jgi:hypothetical protein
MSLLANAPGGNLLEPPTAQLTGPPAQETLARIRQTLLPHQIAFCDDTEHRKLALVCGFGAGKTHGLVAKAVHMAALNIGYVSALFEPVAPMLRDILQRTMDDLLEEWEIPFDFRVSPLPEYSSISRRAVTPSFCGPWRRGTGFVARTFAPLVLTKRTRQISA